jgi:Icc-related predicted phosphoesterase
MKHKILSDVHLDFYVSETNLQNKKFKKQLDKFIYEELCLTLQLDTILIISGDLGHYNSQNIEFLKECKKLYKEILVVLGNHDLYFISKSIARKYDFHYQNRIDEMKKLCKENGIILLDGDVVEIDGIKYGGLMGWYDVENYTDLWLRKSNDAKMIYTREKHINYGMYSNLDYELQDWGTNSLYDSELEKLYKIYDKGCDVLISHIPYLMPELDEGLPQIYVGDNTNRFYFVEKYNIIKEISPKFCLFGHTHCDYKFVRDKTIFICNPMGYPNEKYKDEVTFSF